MTLIRSAFGALILCVLALSAGCAKKDRVDLIIHGGPILTMNAKDEVAQALAVSDDRIAAVGSEAEVMALKGPGTTVIDLKGRALLPGFVAAHEHPTLTAVFNSTLNLSGFKYKTNAEVWDALRAGVRKTPKGEWCYAGGLDIILTPDLQLPTRKTLDEIAPDTPIVIVSQTLHSVWANSKAFERAGITKNTPDPGSGSYYERDAQGELTGYVAELRAAAPLLKDLKSPWKLFGRYERVLNELLANGFTSVASLGYNVPPLMARYVASQDLHPRIRQFFYLVEDELKYLPDKPDRSNPFFRVLGIKLWHDGSPYTGGMFINSAYLESPLGKALGIKPGSHGEAMIPQDTLIEKIRKYQAEGWQVSIHSQGDASNRAVSEAILKAGPVPNGALPLRVEHALLLPEDLLKSLAEQGTTVSFHINHILYYGDALRNSLIGQATAQQVLPVRRAFELGMHPTLHADSPMFPPDAFSLMKTAITRQTASGVPLNAAQAIDIRQAMRAMTVNGAYQLGIDRETGSLEPGKWADLQVVSKSPYAVSMDELSQLRIEAVYVAGALKYQLR
jgi:predicted amidohydrolase YtcJ